MNYLAAAILGIAFVELIYRLPVLHTAKTLTAYTSKSLSTIHSGKISDHWKEKVLLIYAGKIATYTIKLALFFIVILVVIYLLSFAFDVTLKTSPPVLEFLITIPGIIFTTVISVAYARLRFNRG